MTAWLSLLLLVVALSVDSFAAALAYGAEKIKIPLPSLMMISFICSLTLGLSLWLGNLLSPLLSNLAVHWLSFSILLILALFNLFSSAVKDFAARLRKRGCCENGCKFKLFDTVFFICACDDCRAADRDNSHSLSVKESLALAFALSIDGVTAGFGAGVSGGSAIMAALFCFVLSASALFFGVIAGDFILKRCHINLSYLGGGILLILAFSKLLMA